MTRAREASVAALAAAVTTASLGCDDAKTYATTMEVLQVERFGERPEAATQMSLELRYADCPGDNRRVIRTDEPFARCAAKLSAGDRVPAEIVTKYVSERGTWRSDVVKLGDCTLKLDPKEEANYELVQTCTPLKTTGAIVGVHCDRSRGPDLVGKCPWLRRR